MALDAQGRVIPDAPATGWAITSQQETLQPGPGGRVTEGIVVRFTTARGQEGSVFLARGLYTPINVRAAVAAHAAVLDQVANLSG